MVACSKAFLETEIWEVDEILSLENVCIQTVMKKDGVTFQEPAAGVIGNLLDRPPSVGAFAGN